MIWLGLLIAVALIVATAAVTGLRPKGTRPVARSGLMTAARIVLVMLVALVAYVMWTR